MKRRTFIALIGGAAGRGPRAAGRQAADDRFFGVTTPSASVQRTANFVQRPAVSVKSPMHPSGKARAPRMPLGIYEPVVFLHGSVRVGWVSIVGVLEEIVVPWSV